MECLDANQITTWAEHHGLLTRDGLSVNLPVLPSVHRELYATGRRSGREGAAAATMVGCLGAWEECVVWIRGWGVWPSGEDWPKFYAWRGRLGERRPLQIAPGHCFGVHEAALLVELTTLVMENAWDADVLCSVDGRADRIHGRISHDEWFEVYAAG